MPSCCIGRLLIVRCSDAERCFDRKERKERQGRQEESAGLNLLFSASLAPLAFLAVSFPCHSATPNPAAMT
jgi:hypothetical protein